MKCVIKTLVTCHSLTGNTREIAQAIYEECSALGAVEFSSLSEVDPLILAKYDLAFIGSPCHAGNLAQPALDFLESLPGSCPATIAGFFTHSAPLYEEQGFIQCISTFKSHCDEKNIHLAGIFHCQGFLAPELHDMIKKAKGFTDEEWNERFELMNGHPDATDKTNARAFASSIMKGLLENQ